MSTGGSGSIRRLDSATRTGAAGRSSVRRVPSSAARAAIGGTGRIVGRLESVPREAMTGGSGATIGAAGAPTDGPGDSATRLGAVAIGFGRIGRTAGASTIDDEERGSGRRGGSGGAKVTGGAVETESVGRDIERSAAGRDAIDA
ncbi:MAG TPA: hypothetical protein PLI18_05380 [Pirellulaceae bacterium]|nr:hypothetical protein [Pirellulaceae bacterium]